MKFTRWFSDDTKPGEKMAGVYRTRFRTIDGTIPEGYAKWYGYLWGYQYATLREAIDENVLRGDIQFGAAQNKGWRGLVTKDGK